MLLLGTQRPVIEDNWCKWGQKLFPNFEKRLFFGSVVQIRVRFLVGQVAIISVRLGLQEMNGSVCEFSKSGSRYICLCLCLCLCVCRHALRGHLKTIL